MRHRSLSLTCLFAILSCSSASAQSSLEAGFMNPPEAAKPHTWWHWNNGNISKEGITADLEAMKRIGLGGAQIFNVEQGVPAGKVPFMSPQWQEAVAHACREAKRLGLELCIHNGAGWSSSGGPWVKPEDSMQEITWSESKASGGQHVSMELPKPPSKLGCYRDIVVLAFKTPTDNNFRNSNIRAKAAFERGDQLAPDPSGIPSASAIPLSDIRVVPMDSKGHVNWDVPAGSWTLLRVGYTPTGAENEPAPKPGLGPEVDKLSREALEHFFGGMMASAIKDNGPIGKYGLVNTLIDSYEVGSQNWTPKFREEFKKRRGYDPMTYLPAMTGRVVESGEVTERFLWDVRRTVCDLFADNYFGYMKELCHRNGLKFSNEGYGNGSFDNLQVSGLPDIPMGEFWVGGGTLETLKMTSSAAHTNGKPIVGAESFTADTAYSKYLMDPYGLKALGDRAFSLGINRYIFHRYAHQPWLNLEPGMTMGPWGINFERTITWWDQGRAWIKYITRSQYLLQSGRFVADVAVFEGEEGPNDIPLLSGKLIPKGYDYDGCDATVLQKMTVENGLIALPDGMRYRVLVLPDSKWMTPKTARKIAQLVNAGATVIGPKPTMSPSLEGYPYADQKLAAIVDPIWNKVHVGQTVQDVLERHRVQPDLEATKPVNWIHRFDQGADIYFVANPAYRPADLDVTFRVDGRQPELWNAEDGTVQPATVWRQSGGRTKVSLHLESAGSVFVVFRKPAKGYHLTNVAWLGQAAEAPKPPKIEVVSARYEAVDGAGGVDVTDKAKELLSQGATEITANNSNFGDPTYNHVKRLHIVYTIDGKQYEKNIEENQTLEFGASKNDLVAPEFLIENGKIQVWQAGGVQLTGSDGVSFRKKANPGSQPIDSTWKVTFPEKKAAPKPTTLSKLISWPDSKDPALKYFSGTATYTTTFVAKSASPKAAWLDLGRVKNFAEVELNGHKFETLWKAPFRVEVSKYLRKGQNKLVVKVTNLWPNRIIGDEQYPAEAEYNGGIKAWPKWIDDLSTRPETKRSTFSVWHFYNKDSALLDSGLIGPVKLVYPDVIAIRAK